MPICPGKPQVGRSTTRGRLVIILDSDYGILGGYFACIICFGIFISLYGWWKRKRNDTQQAAGDFFLASRTMMFLPVAGSIFSSNIGAQHFIGLAGTAAANGIAVGVFEWSAMILLLARAWLFLPVYISSGITTMPEVGFTSKTILGCPGSPVSFSRGVS